MTKILIEFTQYKNIYKIGIYSHIYLYTHTSTQTHKPSLNVSRNITDLFNNRGRMLKFRSCFIFSFTLPNCLLRTTLIFNLI